MCIIIIIISSSSSSSSSSSNNNIPKVFKMPIWEGCYLAPSYGISHEAFILIIIVIHYLKHILILVIIYLTHLIVVVMHY